MKKQLFEYAIGLLLAVMLVACSSDDELFSFDNEGELIVRPINAESFDMCALGHGWKVTEMYEMYDDGTYDHENYYSKGLIGGTPPSRYEFSDGKVIVYHSYHMGPSVYSECSMRYDERSNKLYFNDRERYKVVSVSTDEIRLISIGMNTYKDGTTKKYYGYYTILQRLSDQELQDTRENYWVNDSDMNRDMTWNDLIHKWILMYYSRGSDPRKVPFDRNDDNLSIQFFPDGTVRVKNFKDVFEGTFEYNGRDSINLIQQDGAPDWRGSYFQDITSIKMARIYYGAYLELSTDKSHYYQLIRAKSDE